MRSRHKDRPPMRPGKLFLRLPLERRYLFKPSQISFCPFLSFFLFFFNNSNVVPSYEFEVTHVRLRRRDIFTSPSKSHITVDFSRVIPLPIVFESRRYIDYPKIDLLVQHSIIPEYFKIRFRLQSINHVTVAYVNCTIRCVALKFSIFFFSSCGWWLSHRPVRTWHSCLLSGGPLRRVIQGAAETSQPGEDLTTKISLFFFPQLLLVLDCVLYLYFSRRGLTRWQ